MNIFFTALFFILGTAVGSFITVLIHRTRHYETGIVGGRSKCTHCKKELEPRDLVPILSYILLRGRCRKCEKPIKSSYLVIEMLTGALFAFLYTQFPFVVGNSVHGMIENSVIEYTLLFQLLYHFIIATLLVTIFFYDIFFQEIPDMFSLPLIAITLLGAVLIGNPEPVSLLLGAALGLGFFGGQFWLSKGKWIGGGDIRLGIFMGVFLGWKMMLLALFISYIIGAIWSIGLVSFKKLTGKSEIAFGPFLIIGTLIAKNYGTEILDWYLKLTLL